MEIGNIKITLSDHTNEITYSDGSIESELLEIVKSDINLETFVRSDNRWPILYHLSPARHNLLRSFDFSNNDSVLEVGAGCGAFTGVLCDKFKNVTAVELSRLRAEVLAHRNKNRTNLEVIIGNLNDLSFDKEFDAITLIGVLEYAGKFTQSPNPYNDFLVKMRGMLKPGGQLIIAIENRYGLKYWAGFKEDHLGKYFAGLEGYDINADVCTFSKKELESLLSDAGFKNLSFYYPLPDYKFASTIVSENYNRFQDEMDVSFVNYDMSRVKIFDETKVFQNIVRENKLDFFANSFLVFAGK